MLAVALYLAIGPDRPDSQVEAYTVLFTIPRPVLYELNEPAQVNDGVRFEVEAQGEGVYVVRKTIGASGQAWLRDDPERRLPAVVDDGDILLPGGYMVPLGTSVSDSKVYVVYKDLNEAAPSPDPLAGRRCYDGTTSDPFQKIASNMAGGGIHLGDVASGHRQRSPCDGH